MRRHASRAVSGDPGTAGSGSFEWQLTQDAGLSLVPARPASSQPAASQLAFQHVFKEAAMRSFVLAVTTIALSVLLAASCVAAAQTPGETPGQASAWIPKDEFIRQEKAFMDSLVLLKVLPPDSGRRVSVLHELYQFFTGQRDAGGGGAVLREGPGESYRALGGVHPGATFAALGETV